MITPEWRRMWRDGIAPLLSVAQLAALADALTRDDPRLTQGSTTTPPPLMCVLDWPCEAACALAFCGVVDDGGFGTATVGAAEEAFCRLLRESDQRTGQPADVRHFLNWFDDTPREEMRRDLLPEVNRELELRRATAA